MGGVGVRGCKSGALIFSSALWAKKNSTPTLLLPPRQTRNFEKTPLIKVLAKFLYPPGGGGKQNVVGYNRATERSFGLSFFFFFLEVIVRRPIWMLAKIIGGGGGGPFMEDFFTSCVSGCNVKFYQN